MSTCLQQRNGNGAVSPACSRERACERAGRSATLDEPPVDAQPGAATTRAPGYLAAVLIKHYRGEMKGGCNSAQQAMATAW